MNKKSGQGSDFSLPALSGNGKVMPFLKENSIMSRVCDVCGKGPSTGCTIVRHGLAKAKGGIGLHTTGISKRRFLPNLRSVRSVAPNGTVSRTKVCASCLKSGKVTKPSA
jgi:large subunit ribosomal protein L28